MDRIHVPVTMIPRDDLPEDVNLHMKQSPDSFFRFSGKLYLSINNQVLCCSDSTEGVRLFSALASQNQKETDATPWKDDIYYRVIHSSDPNMIHQLAEKYKIREQQNRLVVIFQCKASQIDRLAAFFRSAAPLESKDHVLETDHHQIVLVKDAANRSDDEICEFAAAVIDTMVSEGIANPQAAVGTMAEHLAQLPESFKHAMEALELGNCFHPGESLYQYRNQEMERVIYRIPEETRASLLHMFYSRFNRELFDEEMMETIRVFFEHDLNITSASKQLFIHRNTLNYRLDKIKRYTGLDLRSFKDAAVFSFISEIAGMTNHQQISGKGF